MQYVVWYVCVCVCVHTTRMCHTMFACACTPCSCDEEELVIPGGES